MLSLRIQPLNPTTLNDEVACYESPRGENIYRFFQRSLLSSTAPRFPLYPPETPTKYQPLNVMLQRWNVKVKSPRLFPRRCRLLLLLCLCLGTRAQSVLFPTFSHMHNTAESSSASDDNNNVISIRRLYRAKTGWYGIRAKQPSYDTIRIRLIRAR